MALPTIGPGMSEVLLYCANIHVIIKNVLVGQVLDGGEKDVIKTVTIVEVWWGREYLEVQSCTRVPGRAFPGDVSKTTHNTISVKRQLGLLKTNGFACSLLL